MRDHRHLIVWRKARRTVLKTIDLSKERWKPWAGAMLWQLSKASLSTQLNIGEGWALGKPGQRVRHWRIAYGSAEETVDLLELMRDSGFLEITEAEGMLAAARDVSRILRYWLIKSDLGRNTQESK